MKEFYAFLKENNLDNEYYFEDFFPEWNDYDDSITIGFLDEETQANGYFKEGYPLTAETYTLKEEAHAFGYKYGVIIADDDYVEYYIFKTKEEAFEYAKSLENTKLLSIEEYIEDFKKLLLNDYIDIVPIYEATGPHGYYTSYNIYMNDMLVIDGAYVLDEKLAEEVKMINDFLDNDLELNGYSITSIKKISGFPSWEKLYEIGLRKNDFYTTVEIDLHYYPQKMTRNVVDIIVKEIDWDSLEEEYESEMNER